MDWVKTRFSRTATAPPAVSTPPCDPICRHHANPDAIHQLTGANNYLDLVQLATELYTGAPKSSCHPGAPPVPMLDSEHGRHPELGCGVGRLGMALMHLRGDLPFATLATLFTFTTLSGRVSILCNSVYVLLHDWHKPWVGLRPEDLEKHIPDDFKAVWPLCILVGDATYYETDKMSVCTELGRKVRSWMKKNAHAKTTNVTAPDGWAVTVGNKLYGADHDGKDNVMLRAFLEEGLGDWCREVHTLWLANGRIAVGDKLQIMLDRGYDDDCIPDRFRDILTTVTPFFTEAEESRLSTDAANRCREITAFRNVIESFNRRLQEYRLLRNHVPHSALPMLHKYVCIVAALQNRWRRPLRGLHPHPPPTEPMPVLNLLDLDEMKALEFVVTKARKPLPFDA
jgi:hypothetical protein